MPAWERKLDRSGRKGASLQPQRSGTLPDCLFLGGIVLLSVVLYLPGLGFHGDDWHFLGAFRTSPDRSLAGLYSAINEPNTAMRPVQLAYLAALYQAFGLAPLGYHITNAAVLLCSTVLLYLVARELQGGHVIALAVALVYALLPHYSTVRFWVAAFQAPVSIALYLLSLYGSLRALLSPRAWTWNLLALVSLVASGLAYEVALPLFLLNPVLVWCRGGQLAVRRAGQSLAAGTTVLALLAVIAFKLETTTRLGSHGSLSTHVLALSRRAFSLDADPEYGLNIAAAIRLSYGDYGIGLQLLAWRILRDHPDPVVVSVAAMLGLLVFGYLFRATSQQRGGLPGRHGLLACVTLGGLTFGLGYAIFLTNTNLQLTDTGLGNRTAIAATVGVALSLVGALGLISTMVPSERARRGSFSALVALLCVAGFLVIQTIAPFWVEAYRQERAIVADIRQHFPALPSRSVLILDGVCPYVGPAIVFESSWDLSGALTIFYADKTLVADVVTPNMTVGENGLRTVIYESAERDYPYGNLLIYHYGRKEVHPLPDAEAARRYFEAFNPDRSGGCPHGHEGRGVPIF